MTRICRLSLLVVALIVSVATPAVADTFFVYSQKGIGPPCDGGACYFQYCLEGEAFCQASEPGCTWGCGVPAECDVPEGGAYQRHSATWNIDPGYVGWGTIPKGCPSCPLELQDMRDFAGDFKFFVRVQPEVGNHRVKVEFECRPDDVAYPSGVGYVAYATNPPSGWPDHGWQQNTSWQEISIPLDTGSFIIALDLDSPTADNTFGFEIISPTPPIDDACLSAVQAWSKVTLENVDDQTIFATMSIDFIRWEKANNHAGASEVTTDGRQLKVDGKPFVVNGVAYNPIAIGENFQFGWEDRADRYDVDYPLIADLGANAIRVYAPLVTTAMLDKAWAEGLFVIPTFGVDSINLECAEGKSFMLDRFVDTVTQWKDHPAILFWLVGNEVNNNLTGGVGLCGDWYPQLDAMALAAETAGATQPVGTAVAGMIDVCSSCSDDLDLPNVDLWATQLYPGCDFGSSFAAYSADPNCERPLIITETGVDAFHQPFAGGGSEDQAEQAGCINTLVEDANADLTVRPGGLGVLSGLTFFEWADEWWKGECTGSSWTSHDNCVSFNPPFPDGKAHEEWFGLVGLDSGNSAARLARTVTTTVGEKWLGPVCNMRVDAFDKETGNATVSFAPPTSEAVDTNLYYGSLSDVSTPTYSGTLAGLGTTGSAAVTLPAGDLFWVVAAENIAGEEGCYGMNSAGTERPCSSGNCNVNQVSGWNCWCRP
jgi:hypothetical protein